MVPVNFQPVSGPLLAVNCTFTAAPFSKMPLVMGCTTGTSEGWGAMFMVKLL